jgi:hypothetical protein
LLHDFRPNCHRFRLSCVRIEAWEFQGFANKKEIETMKRNFLAGVIGGLLVFGAVVAQAQTTETVATTGSYTGKVVNSTYTFTNIGTSGTTAVLDQTTIPNLTDGVPYTSLQLVLDSLKYADTQDTFVGTGAAPTITFDLSPTLQMMNGGNYGSLQVTLYGPVIASGQHESDVVFTLQSPVTFPQVGEMNPQNLDEGSGTFNEQLSNLEPSPDSLTLVGATLSSGQPIQANNSDFSFGGTLEIFYAAPEPRSGWLALLAGAGFAGVVLARRGSRSPRCAQAGLKNHSRRDGIIRVGVDQD